MLTTSDKVLLTLFTVVCILSAAAVGSLVFVYAGPLVLSDFDRIIDRKDIGLLPISSVRC